MSSKKELDRELSSVRREAILRLCRDAAMAEEGIDMLKAGEHVVAVLKSVNSFQEICDGSLTNSRAMPLLGSCIVQGQAS